MATRFTALIHVAAKLKHSIRWNQIHPVFPLNRNEFSGSASESLPNIGLRWFEVQNAFAKAESSFVFIIRAQAACPNKRERPRFAELQCAVYSQTVAKVVIA